MGAGEKSGFIVSEKKRKICSGECKAKIALEAMWGLKTVNEIAQDFGVHLQQRSRVPVYRGGLHGGSAGAGHRHQPGRAWAGFGQHLRGASLAKRQIRGVYLKGYADVPALLLGLTDYFVVYNTERSHQALDYRPPDEVYRAGHGGGARIVDTFSERATSRTEAEAISGQRRSAACDPLPS